jgi:hypothetical protein
MSISEMAKMIDKTMLYRLNGLEFSVRVIDMKQAYGVARAEITPIGGNGRIWVNLDSLCEVKN